MVTTQYPAVLRHIRNLAGNSTVNEQTDTALLGAFLSRNDQQSFEALVWRHGPMVLRVCQRALGDIHDAEDALQATFLVLAKRAASIRKTQSLASWLHGVAYRMATDIRKATARRRKRELAVKEIHQPDPAFTAAWKEIQILLDDEIERLPARYREPFILCCLENKSYAEVARLLGINEATLGTRLSRSRKILQRCLTRRGVSLATVLAVAAIGTDSASAASMRSLVVPTAKAAVRLAAGQASVVTSISARVTSFVQGADQKMLLKTCKTCKTAILLLLSTGLVSFGVLQAIRTYAAAAEPGQSDLRETSENEPTQPPQVATEKANDVVNVRGRVLDPDGKPYAGAKLYVGGLADRNDGPDQIRAVSEVNGCFQFNFPKALVAKIDRNESVYQILASAPGFGCDWVTAGFEGKELTIHLVKDSPIGGRIIDSDGRPVAGTKIRLTEIRAYPNEDLTNELKEINKGGFGTIPAKTWNGPLPGQPVSVITGIDGKFRLQGIGRERLVGLLIEGPTIQYVRIQVMTRAAEPVVNPSPFRQQRVYGATFEYLALPSRPIRGIVRDKLTGATIPGVRIESIGTTHRTLTDKDGRYELLGHAKSDEYHLSAVPGDGQPYFISNANIPDNPGLAPLNVNIEMNLGIPVRGRLTDKATGKPVQRAFVAYHPVYPNPNTRDGVGDSFATTGPDGSYSVVALPGPGLIAVTAPSADCYYMPALVTGKEMKDFFRNWTGADLENTEFLEVAVGARAGSPLLQENFSALVLIEPNASADVLNRDIALRPALTVKGTVIGPDGGSLNGANVIGLSPNRFGSTTLKTADFTVRGINPGRPRQLLFLHKEKGLGCFKEIQGDEKGPISVKLQPLGSFSGRVVDNFGQPRAGLVLRVERSRLNGNGPRVETGKDGHFRIDGLVPGQKYDLWDAKANLGAARPDILVDPGKNKDLGDITID
jgi:RNA polymerase sigma factor (sigma-70 family)